MNLSFKMKLGLMSVLALSLVAFVITISSWFNHRIDLAHGQQVAIYQVSLDAQKARTAEKAYLKFYQDEPKQRLEQTIGQALARLADLQSAGSGTTGLKTLLDKYRNNFSRVVALHEQNVQLQNLLKQDLAQVDAKLSGLEEAIRSHEFDLQMEGEELSANEVNLLSLVRDCKNLTLAMQSSLQQFLLTNKPAIISDFDAWFKKIGMGFIAGLEQFARASGNNDYLQPALAVRKLVEKNLARLKKEQDLFGQENAQVAALDQLGDKLLLSADEQVGLAAAQAERAQKTAVRVIALTSLLGALLYLLAGWLVFRSIIRPLNKGIRLAETIEKGDLSRRLDIDSKDEIGRLAQALNRMADSLEAKANLAKRIAEGDLSHDVELASDRDVLGRALKTMVENLRGIFATIRQASEQVTAGSEKVAESSQSLSQGATESASSIEEISATIHQLESQTRTNADNAGQANNLAGQAQQSASRGSEQMQEMVTAMGEINQASQEISKIIKVIDEIAFQTNLLALNAAVEAARAGQHGKGFAVVAEEVRNLAARSARAAQETADLIESSVELTEKGTDIAHQTADALEEIVQGVNQVSELISEIAIASNEQAEGIAQVNQGLGQIDRVTQQNTANAEESAAASEELSVQARQLLQMLEQFRFDPGSAGSSAPKPDIPQVEVHGTWGGVSTQSNKADELMCWNAQLETGVASIDKQHQKLVELINRTFTTMKNGGDEASIRQVVSELADYTRNHFSHEEKLMQQCDYPQLAKHRQIHQNLLQTVAGYQERLNNGQRILPGELFNLLKKWLVDHISREDRDGYGPHLRGKVN